MEFMDITIINTSIPTIAKSFSIDPISLKFSAASYYVSLAVFIPISGWCTDKFGTKHTFILSVLLFIIASLLCGLSKSPVELTIFRFLQGVGGALMVPAARIILLKSSTPSELIRTQTIAYTPALIGNAVGPFMGGIITTYLSWHWIFYINIPIGLIVIYLGSKYIKQSVSNDLKRFDIFGFIIAGLALIFITIFVEMLNHYDIISAGMVILIGIMGLILFIALLVHCLSKKDTIFDFSLFNIKALRIGFIVYFTTSAIYASVGFLLPIVFQEYMHFSATKSGALILPIAFGTIVARGVAGKFIRKLGFKYCILTNLVIFMIMIILLAQITQSTSIYLIMAYGFIFGSTMILVNSCVGVLNYIDIPKDKISLVTSMDMTSRQFSASLGVGISAFIFTSFLKYMNTNLYSVSTAPFLYTLYFMSTLVLIAIYSVTKLTPELGKAG